VDDDCLKLTAYIGERDRANGGFLADAFTEIYERHELQASLVLRGVEGFGHKHQLRTDRLLTLSEDLPIVSVAVDTRERIEAARAELRQLEFDGLVTLERARMITGESGTVDLPESTKLTVYVGRQERIDGRPAFLAIVDLLHDRGIAGASVLLGVDGTARGTRERARFFARNAQVPVMIIAVGEGPAIAAVLPELTRLLPQPLITLERIGDPYEPSDDDGVWQKLMLYSGAPTYEHVIRELREAGAAGATSLRGIWGYHGDHAPHGDRLIQARRHVPVVTVVIDQPTRAQRWFELIREIAGEHGLITSELVPIR
jgi:PII-like signaling protein